MSYVGNVPTTAAFPFDQFSGNGSTTAFTLSYAPAGTTSIIVSISGVVQNPNTYSVSGTTLTFTPAPPTGTSNIAVLYLGLPVVATLTPGNTAYFSSSVFTATASQTVFTPSGTYQAGFINVIRNGSQLAPADYTATNGTTVTLASACTAGDTVVIEVFNLTSLTGALPLTGGNVTGGVNLATTSGNVGVGTTSPDSLSNFKFIDVGSSGTNQGVVQVNNGTVKTAIYSNGTEGYLATRTNHNLNLQTNGTTRATIDTSGNLLVGTTTSQGRLTVQTATTTAGTRMAAFADANGRFSGFYEGADGTTFNAANTVLGVRSTTGTGRSINASGTVNASGADYAEYMTKAGDFVVSKGDVVGINQQGLLTNVFAEAVSFVVKSTSPSYVGGDTWGGGFEDDLEALEAARQKVDRIAFAGQVPVNVLSATPGQYIVPVEDNGGIRGVAKNEADLTLTEYMRAVGKVIAIETDGRAKIIVKVA